MAYLTNERDPDALLDRPDKWRSALIEKFRPDAAALMMRAGRGLRALLDSEPDLAEAHFTADVGLLASQKVNLEAFRVTGERVISDVIERIEQLASIPIPK